MHDTEDGPSTGSVVVEMLVETHCWLEEDEHCDHDETDDLVVAVELAETVGEYDAHGHADDEEDCAEHLERCVDVSDFLGGGEVQRECEHGEQRQE